MSALPHIRSMAFFDSLKFGPSYGFAQKFAGEEGHIATLPEIISARAKSPEAGYLWRNWFTSSSSEYFGFSKGGVPIIIVAHGVGPMVGLTGIEAAYEPRSFRGDGRPDDHGEGHISLDEFRLLEGGHYGDVIIVEVDKVLAAYEVPFIEAATLTQADRDPLIAARMGKDWRKALEMLELRTLDEGLAYTGLRPKVVDSGGPSHYWIDVAREGWPFAQLLAVGQTMESHRSRDDGGITLSIDVHCNDRTDGKRFISVRPGGRIQRTHQGPAKLRKHVQNLLMPNPLPPGDGGFFCVKQFDNQWFTQTPKNGCAMDTGWPEYPVTDLEVVGALGKIVALDETMFFRYDVDDVLRQAPPEANAYYKSSEPKREQVGDQDALVAEVVFCRVEIDESQKIPAEDVLDTDYDLQMELLERLEQKA